MTLQMLVILAPVFFGMMGFAIDLGRLYLVRGELSEAANAMALAAAAQLIGTSSSLDNAGAAATQSIDPTNPLANKYFYASLPVGQSTGNLVSSTASSFYATVADATAGSSGSQADGTTARDVLVSVTADTPLLFWSILPLGQSRKTTVAAQAIAGISAPLCTACGIEPFLVAALDSTDTVNFGFGDPTAGNLYTLAFECSGTPAPAALPGTATVIPYGIVNRYDTGNATLDETQQLFADGASGLIASADPNPTGSPVPLACVGINDASEVIWASTSPNLCSTAAPVGVEEALCGIYSRFDNLNPPGACQTNVSDFATIATAFLPDTDITTGQANLYTDYTGNARRVITLPIVAALAPDVVTTMTVLGFRQFLVELNSDGTFPDPTDINGRFVVMYIGSPKPVPQGYVDDRFSLACPVPVPSGPGKVVLHQ
ncbi:MAG TPA: pilus assembly protein TadG-related protein [Bryobacteraceae bacterium]|nr:pilus assembly protein TadG-related protein [Bryobacteraceae bacterium]